MGGGVVGVQEGAGVKAADPGYIMERAQAKQGLMTDFS